MILKCLFFAFSVFATSLYAMDPFASDDKANNFADGLTEDDFDGLLPGLEKRPQKKKLDQLLNKLYYANSPSPSKKTPPKKRKKLDDCLQRLYFGNDTESPAKKTVLGELKENPTIGANLDNHQKPMIKAPNILIEESSDEENNESHKSIDLMDSEEPEQNPTNISINLLDPEDPEEITNTSIYLLDPEEDAKNDPKVIANLVDTEDSKEEESNIPEGAYIICRRGKFTCYASPNKAGEVPHHIIYIGNAIKRYGENRIAPEDRLDFSALLPKKGSTELDLLEALLKIEIKILSLIKKDPKLVTSIVYVGQTIKSMHDRAVGHKHDFVSADKINMAKRQMIELALDSGYDVRFSWCVKTVMDDDNLDRVEAFISNLFFGQIFGASAVIANKKAHIWLEEKYKKWPPREEKLKEANLYQFREQLGIKLFENKINGINNNIISNNNVVSNSNVANTNHVVKSKAVKKLF